MAINPNSPHRSDQGVTIFARKRKRRKFRGDTHDNPKLYERWRMRYRT